MELKSLSQEFWTFPIPPVAVVFQELHKMMIMSCSKTIIKITIMKNKVHNSKYILPKELALPVTQ